MKHEPVTISRLWSTYCFHSGYGYGRCLLVAALATTAAALLLAGLGLGLAAFFATCQALSFWLTSARYCFHRESEINRKWEEAGRRVAASIAEAKAEAAAKAAAFAA